MLIFGAIGIIVAGVAALAVMSSMTVSLFERRHELAALQAIGARRRRLRGLVLRELLPIATVGVLGGLALGALGTRGIIASFESSNAIDIGVVDATGSIPAIVGGSMIVLVMLAARHRPERHSTPGHRHPARSSLMATSPPNLTRAREWSGEQPAPAAPARSLPGPLCAQRPLGRRARRATNPGGGWDWDRAKDLAERWFKPLADRDGWLALGYLFAGAVIAPFLFGAMVAAVGVTFGSARSSSSASS